MPKLQVDFLHIGLHKTASTYLQKIFFPNIKDLVVLNNISTEIDTWFVKSFIDAPSNVFDNFKFIHDFKKKTNIKNINSRLVTCISEENLSGNIYTGDNMIEICNRIHNSFEPRKILIILRNQVDMLLSLYSNYIHHKGKSNFEKWLNGDAKKLQLLINKLNYSNLISLYIKNFGEDKVAIYTYEDIFGAEGISNFLSEFGLAQNNFSDKRINPGTSLKGNEFLRLLNVLGLPMFKGRQQIGSLFRNTTNDRKIVMDLIPDEINFLFEMNKNIEKDFSLKFNKLYFNI